MLSAVAPLIQSVACPESFMDEARIHRMELFLYDQAKLALPASYRPLHCGLLRLSGNGATGWAEFEFSDGSAHLDLVKWGQAFRHLKRLDAAEAMTFIRQYEQQWGFTRTHLAAEAVAAWQKALLQSISPTHVPTEPSTYMKAWTHLPMEREFLSYYCQSYYSF
ncbi:hypothetical protein [Paenibacillus wenxiniae]|uniref:Uncharacterized protein n=1 Tax=Paenibacillus wenxiniae TaxID=1636843 RepID=A0ABW4RER7_9BACL